MEVSLPLPGGRVEHGLVRLGVRDHVARLLAATPSLRASWFIAGAVAIGFSAWAASTGPRGMLLFLVVAPLIPLAGVAAAYGPWMDPMHEVARATPTSGIRVVLLRAAAVLVSTAVLMGAASLALPNVDRGAAAWILPSLSITLVCLALSTFVPVPWAAGAVTLLWLTVVLVAAGRSGDRFAAFHGPGQACFFVVVVVSTAVLAWRRERLEVEGRATRQRFIEAAETERRRIERNIHDGAQQQLVAIGVKAGLARAMVLKDPDKAVAIIDQIRADTQAALEGLRDLTRGAYPPILADEGLAAALTAKAKSAPLPVTLEATGVDRLPKQVEIAAYFCCSEAIQNAAKYAKASSIVITLRSQVGALAFSVVDDGRGFEPSTVRRGVGMRSMAERVESLGGTFEVRSAIGAGTTIAATIPLTSG